jgi:hypothetical protein
MERWRTDAGSFSRQRVLFSRVPIVLYMRVGSRPGEEAEGTVPNEDKKRAAGLATRVKVEHPTV